MHELRYVVIAFAFWGQPLLSQEVPSPRFQEQAPPEIGGLPSYQHPPIPNSCAGIPHASGNRRKHPCPLLPKGAMPAPLGTSVNAWNNEMMTGAELDDFTIYRYEWRARQAELGPFGIRHINQIVHRLDHVPFPIILEPEASRELSEARRMYVVTLLANVGVPNPDQRVVIRYPLAEGLRGAEALSIYPRLIGGSSGGAGLPFGGLGGVRGGLGSGFGSGGFRGSLRGGFGGSIAP